MWQERSEQLSFEFQVESQLCGGLCSKPGDFSFLGLPCQSRQLRDPRLITGIAKQVIFLLASAHFPFPLSQPVWEARVSNDVWRKWWFLLLLLWDWRSPWGAWSTWIQTPAGWPPSQAWLSGLPSTSFCQPSRGGLANKLSSQQEWCQGIASAGLRSSYQISKMQLWFAGLQWNLRRWTIKRSGKEVKTF